MLIIRFFLCVKIFEMMHVDMLIITAKMLHIYLKQATLVILKEEGSVFKFGGCKNRPNMFIVIFPIWSVEKSKIVTYCRYRFRYFLRQNLFLSLDSQ